MRRGFAHLRQTYRPMVAPTTIAEFVQLVERTEVIDSAPIREFVSRGDWEGQPVSELADALVREGLLTRFQAEQMLRGKCRGFVLGNYNILERLGTGGKGNVFLAEHIELGRRVAVKILSLASANDPRTVKRFYREARAAAALNHPNIVRCHDIGHEGARHFLVMDFVDGVNLADLVRRRGPLNILRACHYIAQAAHGLHYAHQSGLVHRDVKPGNLIVDREGRVRILDLGFALCTNAEDEEVLTRGPLGTVDYLAPEQAADSHHVDARADIYGLGATFYYLLSGRPPFHEAKTIAQKLTMLHTRMPPPLCDLRDDVPRILAGIIEKMMAKDPAKRQQTVAEVVDDLQLWTQKPIAPPTDDEIPSLCPALLRQKPKVQSVGIGLTRKSAAATQLMEPHPSEAHVVSNFEPTPDHSQASAEEFKTVHFKVDPIRFSERRQSIRYARILKVVRETGEAVKLGSGWLGKVVNISAGGAAIHLGDRFEPGNLLTISIKNPATKSMLGPRDVKVVYCTEEKNGTWMMGTQFVTPLSEVELDSMLSEGE
ncbi:MAG: hypothetical protein KatS3mg105_0965 [Gemmatales bacterium]|nr:MAG: hypothetical protein KatS3mg105_0965 [Gemmatales bacterium]